MNKNIYLFAFTALLSTSTFAGTMRDWVESVYPKINTPLIDTLEIYRTEGFILIDVGANYWNSGAQWEESVGGSISGNLEKWRMDLWVEISVEFLVDFFASVYERNLN